MNRLKCWGLIGATAPLVMIGALATLTMISPLAARAQSAGPYVVMPGTQIGQDNSSVAEFQAYPIGNTNSFYGLFVDFWSVGASGPLEADYLCGSAYANTNWSILVQNPVYVEPDWWTNNETIGPTLGAPGSVIEVNGTLYFVYSLNEGGLPGTGRSTPGVLGLAESTDMTNWTRIAEWTANDGITNSYYNNPSWSQVNYGGTNWITFQYGTNAYFGQGPFFVLPVSLNGMNAAFGTPVQITTNFSGSDAVGVCTIVTNGASGLFILGMGHGSGQGAFCSTNFFGPYTNITTWTLPPLNTDYTPWLLSVSNGTAWYWWSANGTYFSANYGTNWTTLSSSPLFSAELNPALLGNDSFGGIGSKPTTIFRLTGPLNNAQASLISGSDGKFSGTIISRNVDAQTVRASTIIANNIVASGVVTGTARQPYYIHGSVMWGVDVTNSRYAPNNAVGGQQIIVGPDAADSVFLGGGYYSDDGSGYGASGCAFEFEDGNSPVPSPLGGGGNSGFYVNAQTIKFAQAPINSTAGYQANGIAGVTQNLAVQTNSTGPHGVTLEFKNGLYVGEIPY